jgi:5'-nucleotidase
MTLILTNDDGIDAPGLRALWQAVEGKGVIVAPLHHHSGCSHQVTSDRPIHVQRRSEQEYAVDGTPADCTRVALSHLYPDAAYVLSGINAGGNLGADVYVSGTVAAVREAALHRVPGIAISQYKQRGMAIDWDLAARLATGVIDKLWHQPLEPGSFWNVNLPHLVPGAADPKMVFCSLCSQPLPIQYRLEGEHLHYVGEYSQRDRDADADVDVCFSGHIAITLIRL